jgi:hypothetical protein
MNSSREMLYLPYLPSLRSRCPSLHPDLDLCRLTPSRGGQASVADAVDPLEQLDRFLLEGDFLDDIGEFGLSVDITAHEIFAPAD